MREGALTTLGWICAVAFFVMLGAVFGSLMLDVVIRYFWPDDAR